MTSELQRLVDHLGNRLRRSVAIDDPHIRLLAYTAHTSDVDDARVGSIMQRSVPAELIDYLDSLGMVHRATLYYRLHRIEELSGLELSQGDDRFAAHLSLKLARLLGSRRLT